MTAGPAPEPAVAPMTMSIVVQMSPLWRPGQPGNPFAGDLQPFAEQMTGYLVRQLDNFADPRGADLMVIVQVERGEEQAGHQYRSGHYVKDPEAPDGT